MARAGTIDFALLRPLRLATYAVGAGMRWTTTEEAKDMESAVGEVLASRELVRLLSKPLYRQSERREDQT